MPHPRWLPALLLLLSWSIWPAGLVARPPGQDDGKITPSHSTWEISPSAGLVFGGLLADAPGGQDIAFGVSVSHTHRPGLRTVYSASTLGGGRDFVFLNARAEYFFRHEALLEPFGTAGAGLIAGDTGSEFDFLVGAGLEMSLADGLSFEEAAIVHLSPARALTDREGNPFTVLESKITFRF